MTGPDLRDDSWTDVHQRQRGVAAQVPNIAVERSRRFMEEMRRIEQAKWEAEQAKKKAASSS
jgi:hypothetical protein